ncbi:hypothetical protein OESDEN_24520, partial [Oesophagostomum dentatum]
LLSPVVSAVTHFGPRKGRRGVTSLFSDSKIRDRKQRLERIRQYFRSNSILKEFTVIFFLVIVFFMFMIDSGLFCCSEASFPRGSEHLSYVHILDLHKDGVIKPHIDSVRYCGDIISGLCLLSDAVMRLRHKDRKDELIADMYVPRRCLYRMGEVGRYEFTHETLSNEESYFNGKKIEKTRRISIICRDLPHPEHRAEGPAIQMRTIPEAG